MKGNVRIMRSSLFLLFALNAFLARGADAGGYQLIGKITQPDKKFTRATCPLVFLDGTHIPFAAQTRADLSGKFKFKDLHPDLFTLIVYIPRSGEYARTVEVSPALADSKKRVFVEITFQPSLASKSYQKVSSSQLSIPDNALREYEKANRKMQNRDVEGAVEHLKKAVEIAPQYVDAWNNLGALAYKLHQFALAETYFREALKHEPDYYPSLVNLGGALLTQGKIQDSLPWNLAALQARPDDALAHSQLGLNYYHMGQMEEAEKYLKQATVLDPGHFSFPQLKLAEIYIARKDSASAARMLRQFLDLHPDAGEAPAVRKQIQQLGLK